MYAILSGRQCHVNVKDFTPSPPALQVKKYTKNLRLHSISCPFMPSLYAMRVLLAVIVGKDVSVGKESAITYKLKESYRRAQLLKSPGRRRRATLSGTSQFSIGMRAGADGVLMRTEPAYEDKVLKVERLR